MQHYIYWMDGKQPNPITKTSPTAAWFDQFKWGEGIGQTSVPVPRLELPRYLDLVTRDDGMVRPLCDTSIWFAIDGRILGYAMVERVELEPAYNRYEIWYDADKAVRFQPFRAPLFYRIARWLFGPKTVFGELSPFRARPWMRAAASGAIPLLKSEESG